MALPRRLARLPRPQQLARSSRLAALLGLSLLGWAAAGCWVPAETGVKMQGDIQNLQADLQAAHKGLEEQSARLTEQMDRADKQIEDVAAALVELRTAARNTDADFGVQLERLIQELQELRGAVELSDHRLAKLEAAQQDPVAAGAATPEAEGGALPADLPKDGKGLLAFAAESTRAGRVAEARGVYRDVIKQWPDEPGVTDQAYFQLGELYYSEKRYRDALPQYIKVAERFKSGRLVDQALFKIGMCSLSIGNLEDASIFFDEVATKHKKSPRAKEAAQKVVEIEKQLEKAKKDKGRKR